MALVLFSITLFVSAFILFLVQPIVGKIILPKLGGTPQVWNTCMVFFQSALLAGYAYTHTSSNKLSTKRQLVIHSILLFLPLILLLGMGPFDFSKWIPPLGGNPIIPALTILTLLVGLPFIVVATSAPLLQKWFGHTGHPAAKDPYFLYAASNLGSLLSLFAYPALIEPFATLRQQAWIWTFGYIGLMGLILWCAYFVMKSPHLQFAGLDMPEVPPMEVQPPPASELVASASTAVKAGSPGKKKFGAKKALKDDPVAPPASVSALSKFDPNAITPWRRLRWILLAAAPSSLMLGVTTYICTDLSPIPLLWIVPLALYLFTFILVFMKWPIGWLEPIGTGPAYIAYMGVAATLAFFTVWGLGSVLWAAAAAVGIFVLLALFRNELSKYSYHQNVLFLQPIGIFAGCSLLMGGGGFHPLQSSILALWAFFLATLMCHGELARTRPGIKHLTEFYLLMSVGGMVGGMFNGLIAPIFFSGVWEFPIAIVLSCLLRPELAPSGFIDRFFDYSEDDKPESNSFFTGFLVVFNVLFGRVFRAASYIAKTGENDSEQSESKPVNYAFDLLLPVLLGLFTLGMVYMAGKWGWNYRAEYNPLFKALRSLGMSKELAATLYLPLYKILLIFLPMLICFFWYTRPLRFGLGVGAILLVHLIWNARLDENAVYSDRSYFGVLRVRQTKDDRIAAGEKVFDVGTYHSLMHGTTHHGLNYQPKEDLGSGNPNEPKSIPQYHWRDENGNLQSRWGRMATTYYHQYGPAGIVMRKYNWFDDGFRGDNPDEWFKGLIAYNSDARMPASLVGLLATPGVNPLPIEQLTSLWSEPPFATIGLGTGTMAAYTRPFQHCHYYEIDSKIRRLSLPEKDGKYDPKAKPIFSYLKQARDRGGEVQVRMGDARLRMAFPYSRYNDQDEIDGKGGEGGTGGGPDGFYHMMVVDAFSSDAIPVHLITKEAIEMYFKKLVPEGVLCVHTSNRHVDLVPVVAAAAKELGLVAVRAHDISPFNFQGHFTSEWVMVARDRKYLDALKAPQNYTELAKAHYNQIYRNIPEQQRGPIVEREALYWRYPDVNRDEVLRNAWTDDYSNVLSVFRWR